MTPADRCSVCRDWPAACSLCAEEFLRTAHFTHEAVMATRRTVIVLDAAREAQIVDIQRARFASVAGWCDPDCKGWFLDGDTGRPVKCDECCNGTQLHDTDALFLPEAQEEWAAWCKANPENDDE